ncbi:MAG: hypothetical protein JWM82_1793, partial [Myxococcales bacterium]|nr:hypothetical protein [Myxococcales bacterium]
MLNSCRMGLLIALLAIPFGACSKNDDASKAAAVPAMPAAP